MSGSQAFSDILTPDMQEEIRQDLGSQELNDIINEIHSPEQSIHDETTQDVEDVHLPATIQLLPVSINNVFPIEYPGNLNFDVTVSPINDSRNRWVDEATRNVEDIIHLPPTNGLLPLPANNVFSNVEYPGDFNFEITVPSIDDSKNPWVLSSNSKKVFVDIMQQFPVDFKIQNRPNYQLFIRTTPQFSAQHQAVEPVYRCIQHEHPQDHTNRDIPEHVHQHVIRCANERSHYLGNKVEGQRLSIIFPLSIPQAGVESVREMFKFACMSSCNPPGMGRREIELIFTLENAGGTVLGRKCLNVKICANYKRDMLKEENKPRKKKTNSTPKGKKRVHVPPNPGKVARPEEQLREYTLPQLKVPGKHNMLKILNYMEDLYSAEILRHQGTSNETFFRNKLNEVQRLKNNLQ